MNLKVFCVLGRIGKVASELITVIDDGRDAGQRGTSAMDDEGTATQRTVLIDKGILRTYLSDRKHAEKLGIRRSGNARRESFRHLPICRMTNTMIAPGDSDPDEIVRSVKDASCEKMGAGRSTWSAAISRRGHRVLRIRDGSRRAAPRATLVGQGPKLMSEIDMVGGTGYYSTGTAGRMARAPVACAAHAPHPSVVIGGRSNDKRMSNDDVVDRALEALRGFRVATAEVLVRDALSGSVETKDDAIDV